MPNHSSSSRPLCKTAISSLVSGFFGWPIIGTLTASMAIVLGHTALWKCRRENLRGRRLAMGGLILGYLSLLMTFLILIGGVVVAASRGDEIKAEVNARFFEKRIKKSYTSAARLFLASETYASQNAEKYPSSWNDLAGRYLTRNDLKRLLQSSHPDGPAESFRLVPHERPPLSAIMDRVVVIQEIAPPHVKEVVVVYADGNSAQISNPDVEIRDSLE